MSLSNYPPGVTGNEPQIAGDLYGDLLADLEEALKSHDWYYDFSDDMRSWRRGEEQWKRIKSLIQQVERQDAERLWKQYAPNHGEPKKDGSQFKFPL